MNETPVLQQTCSPAFKRIHFGHVLLLLAIAVLFWVSSGSSAFSQSRTQPLERVTVDSFQAKRGLSDLWKGVVLSPKSLTPEKLRAWNRRGYEVVLFVDGLDKTTISAARQLVAAQKKIEYFMDVGRSEQMAKSHPEWMSSLQGHSEWRRGFPDFPKVKKGQVVKNYPWVPVFYKQAQDAHLERIRKYLAGLPKPSRIWLNNIQGGPSACGCGHVLCRWTADYGPIKTANSLGDSAPATFVKRVKSISGGTAVVPVMAGECEKEDKHTECGGVGCFDGICWKAFTRQLDRVARESPLIGVACFYKEFGRDLKRYGQSGAWVKYTLNSFSEMPPLRGGKGVKQNRLVAVLQGWNVEPNLVDLQIEFAEKQGVAGVLISQVKLDQGWKPKLYSLKKKRMVDE